MTEPMHPQIAHCTVLEEGGVMQITILPSTKIKGRFMGMPMNAADTLFDSVQLTEQDVLDHLGSKGFSASTGGAVNIKFVSSEEEIPTAAHKRVVLLDILKAVFADADKDSDGQITMAEFKDFLRPTRHSVQR